MRRALTTSLLAASGLLAMAYCPSRAQPVAEPSAVQKVFDAAASRGFAGEVLVATLARVEFEAATGLADREHQRPHITGELWRWASVSKQVAAALALQQVDLGRIQLDDTISQHLPTFKGPSAAQVTIRQLLMHLSGLPNPDSSLPGPDDIPSFYGDAGPDALSYCAGPPQRAPGTAFEYNNCDTLVLGALLAEVAGVPYEQLLQDKLIAPLHLRTLKLAGDAPRARAVAYDAQGRPVPQPRLSRFGASAALEGTARDLLAFSRALMTHKVVSPASTQVMWAGEPRWGYVALGAWGFSTPLQGCAAPVRLVERRGDVGGIQVRNIIAPDLSKVVIVFSNMAEFEFGEIWQGRGFSHDLLAAALCPQPAR